MIKYLGIDWGSARIGLSTGDSKSRLALPYKTVSSLAEIRDIAAQEGIGEIVIGEPRKMSGAKSDNKQYLDFVSLVQSSLNLPVHIIDERLSSLAADKLTGRSRQGADRDSVAAMLILQSYFDQNRNG